MLRAENADAIIDRHEFCPFHPQAPVEKYRLDSDRRKPRPGMLLAVAKEMDLDLSQSWIIGDAARDVEAGKAAGCRAILFKDPRLPASPAAQPAPRVPPDFVASSLEEAMDQIEGSTSQIASIEEATELDEQANAEAVHEPAAPMIAEPKPDAPAEASISTSLARVPRAAIDEPPTDPIAPPHAPPSQVSAIGNARLENLAEQILQELRREHELQHVDFSVSKLLAGIVQVIAVAVMFLAYLNKDSTGLEAIMLLAIFLQALTCSLLIMSRQK
jgi:hypothetical protein